MTRLIDTKVMDLMPDAMYAFMHLSDGGNLMKYGTISNLWMEFGAPIGDGQELEKVLYRAVWYMCSINVRQTGVPISVVSSKKNVYSITPDFGSSGYLFECYSNGVSVNLRRIPPTPWGAFRVVEKLDAGISDVSEETSKVYKSWNKPTLFSSMYRDKRTIKTGIPKLIDLNHLKGGK